MKKIFFIGIGIVFSFFGFSGVTVSSAHWKHDHNHFGNLIWDHQNRTIFTKTAYQTVNYLDPTKRHFWQDNFQCADDSWSRSGVLRNFHGYIFSDRGGQNYKNETIRNIGVGEKIRFFLPNSLLNLNQGIQWKWNYDSRGLKCTEQNNGKTLDCFVSSRRVSDVRVDFFVPRTSGSNCGTYTSSNSITVIGGTRRRTRKSTCFSGNCIPDFRRYYYEKEFSCDR